MSVHLGSLQTMLRGSFEQLVTQSHTNIWHVTCRCLMEGSIIANGALALTGTLTSEFISVYLFINYYICYTFNWQWVCTQRFASPLFRD